MIRAAKTSQEVKNSQARGETDFNECARVRWCLGIATFEATYPLRTQGEKRTNFFQRLDPRPWSLQPAVKFSLEDLRGMRAGPCVCEQEDSGRCSALDSSIHRLPKTWHVMRAAGPLQRVRGHARGRY